MLNTTTLTDVANLALSLIGHLQIRNIEDNQQWAKTIRAVLPTIIQEEQSLFYYPELRTELKLELAEEQVEGEPYRQYNIPTDYVQLIRTTDNTPYIQVGKYIRIDDSFMNSTDYIIEYIRYSKEPSEWTPQLKKCVYARLAMHIAMPITQDPTMLKVANMAYDNAVKSRDRAFKSGSSPIRRRRGTGWNDSRQSSSNYGSVGSYRRRRV